MLRITLFILISWLFANAGIAQQIGGCTDPRAKNYDPSANVNDGSCKYKTTIYNPPFKYLLPNEVKETSGLIFYNEALWTINDSGNAPILFKLTPETGEVVQRIQIANIKNNDWEDLAQDEAHIYIGDFGNNSGKREQLFIYIIDKNDIPYSGDKDVTAKIIEFSFPDIPEKKIRKKNNNFDCEAMICIENSLYLFTKNRGDEQTKIYRVPKKAGNYEAEYLETFNVNGLITGADYNAELQEIILVGYTNKTWQPFVWLLFDYDEYHFFSGNKRRINMLNIPATQTEGVAYTNGRKCVISSEGHPLFTQTAYDFDTGKWIMNPIEKNIHTIKAEARKKNKSEDQ